MECFSDARCDEPALDVKHTRCALGFRLNQRGVNLTILGTGTVVSHAK